MIDSNHSSTRARQDFARALILTLAVRGVRQSELARRLGVSRAKVNSWCRARTQPGPGEVFACERTLEVDPGFLSRHLGFLPVDFEHRLNGQRPTATGEATSARGTDAAPLRVRDLRHPRPRYTSNP